MSKGSNENHIFIKSLSLCCLLKLNTFEMPIPTFSHRSSEMAKAIIIQLETVIIKYRDNLILWVGILSKKEDEREMMLFQELKVRIKGNPLNLILRLESVVMVSGDGVGRKTVDLTCILRPLLGVWHLPLHCCFVGLAFKFA